MSNTELILPLYFLLSFLSFIKRELTILRLSICSCYVEALVQGFAYDEMQL